MLWTSGRPIYAGWFINVYTCIQGSINRIFIKEGYFLFWLFSDFQKGNYCFRETVSFISLRLVDCNIATANGRSTVKGTSL